MAFAEPKSISCGEASIRWIGAHTQQTGYCARRPGAGTFSLRLYVRRSCPGAIGLAFRVAPTAHQGHVECNGASLTVDRLCRIENNVSEDAEVGDGRGEIGVPT